MMERGHRDEAGNAFFKWLDRADKNPVIGAVSMDSLNEQAVLHILRSCRLTPFARYWRSRERTYLYHSLSQKKFCGSAALCDILDLLSIEPESRRLEYAMSGACDAEALSMLKTNGFLVDRDVNPLIDLKAFQDACAGMDERFSVLFLFLTHRCNLRCEYCLGLRGASASTPSMDGGTALRALSLFRSLGRREKATVVLYGGEPLLNRDVLRIAVENIRDCESGSASGTDIELFTNGTLISAEVADFMKRYNVRPVISIDGTEARHDAFRRGPRGGRSFRAAVRGYNTLKKRGLHPAISCVVGAHNVDSLYESVSFFLNRLEAREIRFYPVKGLPSESHSGTAPGDFAAQITGIYPLLRKNRVADNIFQPLMMRLSLERISRTSCSAYGGQLSVMPDGSAGPCINMAEEYRCLWGSVHDASIENSIVGRSSGSLFLRRSPFFREDCRNCMAIALCGGGCIHEGLVRHGDFLGKDAVHCGMMKALLPRAVEMLFEEAAAYRQGRH
jgi:uncharacterized protein